MMDNEDYKQVMKRIEGLEEEVEKIKNILETKDFYLMKNEEFIIDTLLESIAEKTRERKSNGY